jgi:hypothetical protein
LALKFAPAARAGRVNRSVRILSISWTNEDVRMLDVN